MSQAFTESSTLETGLSDFHKIVLTVFKSEAPTYNPYRKYKHLDSEKFKTEITNVIHGKLLDSIIDSLNKVPL